jgi:hypothetical protein
MVPFCRPTTRVGRSRPMLPRSSRGRLPAADLGQGGEGLLVGRGWGDPHRTGADPGWGPTGDLATG